MLCDQVTALKKEAEQAKEKAQSMLDEINAKKENEQAQQFLFDEVEKLNYDETTKKALLTKGEGLSKKEEVTSFLEKERAFLDALAVEEKLKALGMDTKEGKAKAVVTEGEEHSIIDNIMK